MEVAEAVQRADGGDEKFRMLDTRALHNQRLSIAAQVNREMEARMVARGYVMIPREDGNGCEVGGVSQQVMDLFSSRKAALGPEVAKDGGGVPPQVRAPAVRADAVADGPAGGDDDAAAEVAGAEDPRERG